jgi:elongation factor 1-gamma
MNAFWESFDPAGWTIFRGDYNYNEENRMLFMSGNLIGGFIQRTEEIRKWLFGTMTIRGMCMYIYIYVCILL